MTATAPITTTVAAVAAVAVPDELAAAVDAAADPTFDLVPVLPHAVAVPFGARFAAVARDADAARAAAARTRV